MSEEYQRFRRINVIGTSGSGKTTFARRLAEILQIPHFEMDAIFWQPNWQELPTEQYLEALRSKLSARSWVLDGNYSRTTEVKWQDVQCVIWLDLPFLQTVTRVTRRCVRRSVEQEEIWPGTGNRETLAKSFLSPDSVILWSITSYARNRRRYGALMDDPAYRHIKFIRVRSSREADSVLERFRQSSTAG